MKKLYIQWISRYIRSHVWSLKNNIHISTPLFWKGSKKVSNPLVKHKRVSQLICRKSTETVTNLSKRNPTSIRTALQTMESHDHKCKLTKTSNTLLLQPSTQESQHCKRNTINSLEKTHQQNSRHNQTHIFLGRAQPSPYWQSRKLRISSHAAGMVSNLQIIWNYWEHLYDYTTGSFLANISSFIQKKLEISTRTTAMVPWSATNRQPIIKLTQTIVQKVTKYNNAKYNIRIIE